MTHSGRNKVQISKQSGVWGSLLTFLMTSQSSCYFELGKGWIAQYLQVWGMAVKYQWEMYREFKTHKVWQPVCLPQWQHFYLGTNSNMIQDRAQTPENLSWNPRIFIWEASPHTWKEDPRYTTAETTAMLITSHLPDDFISALTEQQEKQTILPFTKKENKVKRSYMCWSRWHTAPSVKARTDLDWLSTNLHPLALESAFEKIHGL